MRPSLIPGLLLLVTALPAAAQTPYLRTANGNWSDPAGWTPTGVPGTGDTADLNGRTVTLDAAATVAVLIFPPTVNSVLGGAAPLTVTDTLRWEAGQSSMTDTLTVGPQAAFRVRGTANLRMGTGGVLLNHGQMVWEVPRRWGDVGRLVNEGEVILAFGETGAFGFCFSSEIDAISNGPTGLIRRTGSGLALLHCGFSNAGTVRVENGSLALRGFNATGGTDTGDYEVEAAGTLVFSGGVRAMTASASITGAGSVEVSGGTFLTLGGAYDIATTRVAANGHFTLNADATMPVLELSGGQLNGSGSVTVTDALTWTGGKMGGSGTTVLPLDFDLSGATVGLEDTRTLRLQGTTTWSGETDINNSIQTVTLVNAGILLSTGPGERTFFAGTFRNEGLLVHDAGTVRFTSGFDNVGEVRIDGGTLALQGFNATGGTDTGVYTVAEGARLAFTGGVRTLTATAEVTGTGTVAFAVSVANAATWRPGASPGVLTVEGTYPAGSGVLEVELGGLAPATEHDQLDATGTATLGGTLRVLLVDGFVPTEGDRFLVVPAASVSGTFAAMELPDGIEAFVETTAEGVELVIGTVVAAEPGAGLPIAFALHGASPNPFAWQTTLRYDVAEAGRVRLAVYDLLGRKVAVLVDGLQPAGTHEAVLDGGGLPSGPYLAWLKAEGFVQARRLTLLR